MGKMKVMNLRQAECKRHGVRISKPQVIGIGDDAQIGTMQEAWCECRNCVIIVS